MKRFTIQLEKVIKVKLLNGETIKVQEGTFEIGNLAYTSSNGRRLGNQKETGIPKTGARWIGDKVDEYYSCPITSILAVIYKTKLK